MNQAQQPKQTELTGAEILAHGIQQQAAELAHWSAAQIDAERAASLPSGQAYGQLGVRVHE